MERILARLVICGLLACGFGRVAPAGTPLCEVDAADMAGPAFGRLERVLARIAGRCVAGDVVRLFAFQAGGHAVDGAEVAPMICRFDAQILLIDHGDGGRRLVCVYAGALRPIR